jgi:hypothetical protein
MEGFQAGDRHDPLPHIALSTTALKSAYENTVSLSAHIHGIGKVVGGLDVIRVL